MLIKHPRPALGRQKAFGVEFVDGVATVHSLHPERERALLQHGFTIEYEGTPFFDLTVSELRELAKIEGIEIPKGAKKADIVHTFIVAGMESD